MGNICTSFNHEEEQGYSTNIYLRTHKSHAMKPEKCNSKAPFVPLTPSSKLSIPYLDIELQMGIQSNGWVCSGTLLLKDGCTSGYSVPYLTSDVEFYSNEKHGLALC